MDFQINKNLIWDYKFSPDEYKTEEFKKWYIARVLTRGGIDDLRSLGIGTIEEYLPKIFLPRATKEFWEYYLILRR